MHTTTAVGYGANRPAHSEAPKGPLLDEVRESLDGAIKEISILTESVRGFVDRTIGPVPTGASNGAGAPESMARSEQVRDRLRWLHAQIGELRGEVNRLDAI